jgi:hypothetical protein
MSSINRKIILEVETKIQTLYPRYFWKRGKVDYYDDAYVLVYDFVIVVGDDGEVLCGTKQDFNIGTEDFPRSVDHVMDCIKSTLYVNDILLESQEAKSQLSMLTNAICTTAPYLEGAPPEVMAAHILSLPHSENRYYLSKIQPRLRKLKRSESL